jgi:hypothetical protein
LRAQYARQPGGLDTGGPSGIASATGIGSQRGEPASTLPQNASQLADGGISSLVDAAPAIDAGTIPDASSAIQTRSFVLYIVAPSRNRHNEERRREIRLKRVNDDCSGGRTGRSNLSYLRARSADDTPRSPNRR